MTARASRDFKKARAILGGIKAAQGDHVDPFVVQQLALVTYKSKDLEPRDALLEARDILAELSPGTRAIPKRWALGRDPQAAVRVRRIRQRSGARPSTEPSAAYEKGFYLKNDYYNGINYAFLLDCARRRAPATTRWPTACSPAASAQRVLAHL